MARIAKSLAVLRDQINALSPNRNKASDGWIGDTKHAARKSDHNPDAAGVVRALDITHDVKHGIDGNVLTAALAASRDPRISYLIWNRRILYSTGKKPWQWQPYGGSNPHNLHFHVSVGSAVDSTKAWDMSGVKVSAAAAKAPATPEVPTLRRGSSGPAVKTLQQMLKIEADSVFGPKTEAAVKAFQKSKKLPADGIVGPYTWEAFAK